MTFGNLSNDKRIFYLMAAILSAAALFLHLWKLGTVPGGIHVDESSIAYNALCVAETGRDEHGALLPVFFRGFDNYHNPVMVYVLVPFMKFVGLEMWAVRLPSALFHIAASVAFFFLARLISGNRYMALLAAFVFSSLPWIFPISRILVCGFTAMLFFLCIGFYFLFRAVASRSFRHATSSGIMLSLAMYSTHAGRPTTALALVVFVLCFNIALLRRWRIFSVFVLTYVLCLVPMIISVMGSTSSMTNRFYGMRVWQDSSGIAEVAGRICERYCEYFSPGFLFVTGDTNITHCTRFTGELYIFLAPFIIAGLYVFIRFFRRNPYYRFLLICLLLYPAAAVMTITHYHSTCCISGSIFWMLAAVAGAVFLWERRRKFGILIAIAIMAAAWEMPYYFHTYFGEYSRSCGGVFNSMVIDAVKKSKSYLGNDETLYVSKYVFFPQETDSSFKPEFYSILLFLFKTKPSDYHEKGFPGDKVCIYPGAGNLDRAGIILRLDRLFIPLPEGGMSEKRDLDTGPAGALLLSKIETPSGINFEIYRVAGRKMDGD